MVFLSNDVWERLSEFVGAHEVIRLLLCGNKALSAQLLSATRRLSFRYAPQSKFQFPSRLPNFRRLISLSVSRFSPHMEHFKLEGFTYSCLPRNLEELDLEFLGTDAELQMDFHGGKATSALPPSLRKLKINTGAKHDKDYWTNLPVPLAPKSYFLKTPNLTALDLSRIYHQVSLEHLVSLPHTMLDLRLPYIHINRIARKRLQNLDSNGEPPKLFFPPHLHTLHFKASDLGLFNQVPTSVTNLAIIIPEKLPRLNSELHSLKNHTSLTTFRLESTGYLITSILDTLPASIEHLRLMIDTGSDEVWSHLFTQFPNLKTLKWLNGKLLYWYKGTALDLPRSLTSISDVVLSSISDPVIADYPPNLTDMDSSLFCSGNEDGFSGLSEFPITANVKELYIHQPNRKVLATIPKHFYNTIEELSVVFDSNQESESLDPTLLEISTHFGKVVNLYLLAAGSLPLTPVTSFNTPLRSLTLYDSNQGVPLRVDPYELDFNHPTLRHLTLLWLPSISFDMCESPLKWIKSLPSTLTDLAIGDDGETVTTMWDSSIFTALPRDMVALIIPLAIVDGTHFGDLPYMLEKLVINGEYSDFAFSVLNELPPFLLHVNLPLPLAAVNDMHRCWEEEVMNVFLKKRLCMSFFSLGHPISIYSEHFADSNGDEP